MNKVRTWIVNALLLPIDYFVSGIFWQMPGMTISSRCGIAMLSDDPSWKGGALRLLGRGLHKLDPNHCIDAIHGDLRRIETTRSRLADYVLISEFTRA